MHGGGTAGIQDPAGIHLGIDQPVVAALHALFHRALQPGQAFGKDRLTRWGRLQLQVFEVKSRIIGSGSRLRRNSTQSGIRRES